MAAHSEKVRFRLGLGVGGGLGVFPRSKNRICGLEKLKPKKGDFEKFREGTPSQRGGKNPRGVPAGGGGGGVLGVSSVAEDGLAFAQAGTHWGMGAADADVRARAKGNLSG